MVEDHAIKIEWMEQVQQEMKEQMKEMMEMIKNLTKEKSSVENPVTANVATP